MPTHAERRFLPYTADQLYALVADVERYPEFLPWCVGARIKRREEQGRVLIADLIIGFKVLRERYTSRVVLGTGRIDVSYIDGPFKRLDNHWQFEPGDGGAWLDFYVDFEFKNRLLQGLMGALFNEAVKLMVGAFENRAKALYGAGS
jgi:coenzyme Q-binding protein COQ10